MTERLQCKECNGHDFTEVDNLHMTWQCNACGFTSFVDDLLVDEPEYDEYPSDGYCVHGTWVGGIGIDWMCGLCEQGLTTPVQVKVYDIFITFYKNGEASDPVKFKTAYSMRDLFNMRKLMRLVRSQKGQAVSSKLEFRVRHETSWTE